MTKHIRNSTLIMMMFMSQVSFYTFISLLTSKYTLVKRSTIGNTDSSEMTAGAMQLLPENYILIQTDLVTVSRQ